MRRPSIVQILLLVVLGALLLILWRGRPAEKPGSPGEPLPRISAERVTSLELERPLTGERVVVRWESGTAWIVEPYRDRADPRFLAQSIRVASELQPLRVLPDTAGAAFGLVPARAIWRCEWAGGGFRIALGDTLPAGGGTFARWDRGPEVLIVDAFLARRFLAPPFMDLHDPVAARLEIGPLDSVQVVTRDERISIARMGEERWRIRKPIEADASSLALARATEALRRESLTDVLGPLSAVNRAALGLDPPRATWTLFQSGREASVKIGSPTEDEKSVYLVPAGRDVVALIASEDFRVWVDGVVRLRDPLILDLSPDSVAAVRVQGATAWRRFVRDRPGSFVQEDPGGAGRAIDAEAFDHVLRNLCATRALGFEDESAGFRRRLLIILERHGGEADTLELGVPSGETGLLRAHRQPGFCRIPSSLVRTWEAWLERPPGGSASGSTTP